MKIGFDAVFLGAYAHVSNANRILDIGAGCGVIGFMLACRNSEIEVLGIEPDELAFKECLENRSNVSFGNRLTFRNIQVQELENDQLFDLIVSNPPYFEANGQIFSESRETARHTTTLSFKELIQRISMHLSDEGIAQLILPESTFEEIQTLSGIAGMSIIEKLEIYTKEGKLPKRAVFTLKKGVHETRVETFLIRDASGEFTQAYSDLVTPFIRI